MRKTVFLPLLMALAACGGGNDATEVATIDDEVLSGDEPGFEAVAPGQYEVSLNDEEGINQLTIHPGMTWSMVFVDGEAAGGTIYQQGGQTCFVTEGESGASCFTTGEIADDGTMTNLASDGTSMTVRPVGSFDQ